MREQMKPLAPWLLLLLLAMLISLQPVSGARALGSDGAILIYHRFGENNLPSTNIRLEQLQQQIAFIRNNGFTPLSLDQLADYRKRGEALPDKALIITVDDAHRSFAEQGWPLFKAAGIPVALFVSTDAIDRARAGGNYLTWDEIRTLRQEGVTIGHHGAAHMHLPQAGIEAAMSDVVRASLRFRDELGFVPRYFAYPYGEYNLSLAAVLKASGFDLGFAQYSSAYSHTSPSHYLPRFPINERYGAPERFRLISQVKALPVDDIQPADPWVGEAIAKDADGAVNKSAETPNPPVFRFTVRGVPVSQSSISCFPSHMNSAADMRLTHITPIDAPVPVTQVEIRLEKPFMPGRSRINCTQASGDGRWYWFGRPFFRTGAED